ILTEAFRELGLPMPKPSLLTFSIHLRASLLALGPYITAFPATFFRANADRFAMKALPIELPVRSWPVAIVTLKNRTLSAVAHLFIAHLRAFARSMPAEPQPVQKSA